MLLNALIELCKTIKTIISHTEQKLKNPITFLQPEEYDHGQYKMATYHGYKQSITLVFRRSRVTSNFKHRQTHTREIYQTQMDFTTLNFCDQIVTENVPPNSL